MTDLYIAARSDNPHVLKVGRSDNPAKRCAGLQCSHCFEVAPLAIWPNAGKYETTVHHALDALREPGPGREWFRASPMEIYSAVALAMGRKRQRSPSPVRSIESMANDLLGRLEIAESSASASCQEDIDALAHRLYGLDGARVISHAGLMRCRTRVGCRAVRCNKYFYTRGGLRRGHRFIAIRSAPSDSTFLTARTVRGGVEWKGEAAL